MSKIWDFPGGSVVKNLPSNAGDAGLIPGQGTKIPHATRQLRPRAVTTEPIRSGALVSQLERSRTPQRKMPRAATKTQHSQK